MDAIVVELVVPRETPFSVRLVAAFAAATVIN